MLFVLLAAIAGGASNAGVAQTASFSYAVVALGGNFSEPAGVAVDSGGNVYVADYNNSAIKEMPAGCASSSCVTTLGGGFRFPLGVAVDRSGNVYVADYGNNALKAMPAGCASSSCVTTVSGGFDFPVGVAVDGSGNVYVANFENSTVNEVPAGCASSSCVTKLGGGFGEPRGVAVDGSGNVYIADESKSAVYEMPAGCASSSCVTPLGGGFSDPTEVAVDGSGNIYVADDLNYAVKAMPAGCASSSCVTPLAGGFSVPEGVAVDGIGNVYVADEGNNAVKVIMTGGVNFFSVPVGTASQAVTLTFTFQSAGSLSSTSPYKVLTQGAKNLDFNVAPQQQSNACNGTTAYAAGGTCTVNVSFTPTVPGTRYGAVELLDVGGSPIASAYIYGTGTGPQVSFPPGTQSVIANSTINGLSNPSGVAVDGNGNIYFSDTANGRVLKETLSAGSYTQSVVANSANNGLHYPEGVAVDGSGNVYIADTYNERILKETLSAGSYVQSVVANNANNGLLDPDGVAVDGSGNVYIADVNSGQVLKETLSAGSYTQSVVANGANNGVPSPEGVAVDGSGNVYIADYGSNRVLKETLLAGSYTQSVVTNGLDTPYGVAVDGVGNVYIADSGNNRVLKETVSAGSYTQTVIANNSNNGLAFPEAIAADGSGNVYIADIENARVLKLDFADPPSLSFATTAYGVNSSDSPQTVTVENVGNVALSFPIPSSGNNPSISANFTLNSGASACPVEGAGTLTEATLAPGGYCDLYISFAPEALGMLNGSVVLTDNNLNAPAPGFTLQSITLSGTAIQATPTITWATPAAIAYGTLLSATQLDASSTVAGTFSYSPAAGTALGVGAHTVTATFTPTNATDYTSATASVTVTVNKATPTITWVTPAAITYGTALGATQLNASSTVAGSFSYSPAAGTVLGAGLHTITTTFTPSNTTDYTTATASVTLAVNQATPAITWATPAAITYGTALGAAQLNASSTVAGSFSYSPAAGTVLSGGLQTLATTFTPTDATDYTSATANVTVTVNQATPAITWATPAAITYGTALGAAQLNASSTVAGSFSYSPAAGTVLTAGSHTITATFTPTYAADYTSATANVTVTVNKATPAITWLTPAAITYGTALGALQLDASSTVAGTFVYSPLAGTVLTAGSHTITTTFTPTDTADYTSAPASVTVTVNKATPAITWATPVAITYGTALGAAQLNASSPVGGSFSYSPAAGTVLAPGLNIITATFTPNDTADYTSATATVMLTVNQITQSITFTPPTAPVTFPVSPILLSATGGASGNPVVFSVVSGPGTVSGTNGSTLTITNAGTVVVAANQAGNTDYSAAPQVTQSIVVNPPAVAIMLSPTPGLSTVLGVSNVTFEWTPAAGATLYQLDLSAVGPGQQDLTSYKGTATTFTAPTLPANGVEVYATLYSYSNGEWSSNSYVYYETNTQTAQLISPTPGPGTILGTSNVAFQWTAGVGVTEYQLNLSTISYSDHDLFQYKGTATSAVVPTLPANASTVYAALYSLIYGVWQVKYYEYTESGVSAPAVLTSPTPGLSTVLGTSNVVFQWTTGNNVTNYQLNLSAIAPGDSELFSYKGTATTATAPSLPANDVEVYARLYSYSNGAWEYNDYLYSEGGTPSAVLTSPTPGLGTVLGTGNVTFDWTTGKGVTEYQLNLSAIGAGQSELYLYKGTATSTIAPPLPANGVEVYARLYSKISGVWQYNDYVYTESGMPTAAVLTSPTPGISTVLGSSSVTFQWSAGIAVAEYELNLSAVAAGDTDLYVYKGTGLSTTVAALPTNAVKVYARLFSKISGVWQYNDYVYTESGTPTPAALTSPTPGLSTILGTSDVTFEWNAGVAVTDYELNLSAIAAGDTDLYVYKGTALTATAPALPANGVKVYARLYSKINGAWQYIDYVYTEQ